MRINLQDIETFACVVDCGSVTRAAHRMSLTQPAVTRRLQNLEATLNQGSLFNRAVKPASLTSYGDVVLAHARTILESVAELDASARSDGEPAGPFRIGVAHGMGALALTSPLDDLRNKFPQIKLEVSADWTSNLLKSVNNGSLDCAVCLLTESHVVQDGVKNIAIGADKIVIVSGRLKANGPDGKAWHLRDLAEGSWFLNPMGCGCRSALSKAFEQLKLPLHAEAELFGEELQLSLVSRSGGLGLVPQRHYDHSTARLELAILNVIDFDISAQVALIFRERDTRFAKLFQQFETALMANL